MLAVKAPGFGERKSSYLEDIAILTGGTVVKEEIGLQLDKVCIYTPPPPPPFPPPFPPSSGVAVYLCAQSPSWTINGGTVVGRG